MNATVAHTDYDITTELAADFPPNVTKLRPVPPARPNADRLADLHRREQLSCQQRIAESKKALKAELADYAAARKLKKAAYEAELLRISEGEAFSKERSAESIAEDERLARYNKGALDALAD